MLNYLMEEMAAVQEENVREKDLKDMEREMKVKNDEINQLQEKLRKYQVGKCGNCFEVKKSCKDGQKVTFPQIGLKVRYSWYTSIITEYTTISVDRDGVVTFTATVLRCDSNTPASLAVGAHGAGGIKEYISSSALLYACQ